MKIRKLHIYITSRSEYLSNRRICVFFFAPHAPFEKSLSYEISKCVYETYRQLQGCISSPEERPGKF